MMLMCLPKMNMILDSSHSCKCVGPASKEPETLEKMMETGMNVARLNFSHGSYEYHAETIKNVRTAVANLSKKLGVNYPLAIALDTKGPEIRTGLLEGVSTLTVLCENDQKVYC